jgi:hypothetical protein
MPPATDPDGPATVNPMLVALSLSNIFAQTLEPNNGHERIQIVIVHAHTVVPQKSSSNPAFPCSASRIKAFPSSPIKLLDSLYRDQTGSLFTQEVSFRGHQLGTWCLQIKVWELGKLTRFSSARR